MTTQQFYLCASCFNVSESRDVCCGRPMVSCNCGELGDERRQPPRAVDGHFASRAPRWYWEAVRGVVEQ